MAEAVSLPLPSDGLALSGLVERVVFHSEETGFCVLRVQLAGVREAVTVVGEAAAVRPGELLRATGQWQTDPSYGRQFRAQGLELRPPSTREGLAAYLGSGLIKGIGPALAKKLVAHFGERVVEVLERRPEAVAQVPGIGKALAGRLAEAWQAQQAVRDIMLFLHSHGISPLRAARIHEAYGARAIEQVSADPYRLVRDVRGIGFQGADALAARLGIARDSPQRARAALGHVLGLAVEEGHTCLPERELLERTVALLGIAEARIAEALASEIAVGHLVQDHVAGEPCVFARAMAIAEWGIADGLRRLAAGQPPWPAPDDEAVLAAAEALLGLELAAGQRQAVRMALASKLLVITGGPGTGKTTLVRAILAALPQDGLEVALAAPTGRAARRLADATGREARTLHRLLEAEPGRGFRRGAERPLECGLLVVDEMSMVDVPLMAALVAALPAEAALLLVGDADQLPSIGPGQILADLIACGRFPVLQLTEIFRQAAASRIVRNAHRINRGLMPELVRSDDGLSDFYAIRAESPEDGVAKVVQLVRERIPQSFAVDAVNDIQVLTPTNKGRLGARSLGEALQAALNPAPVERIERLGTAFAVGDKVMQTENDYEREVYNGDLGRLRAIDKEAETVTVEIDGRAVRYGFADLDRLVPAYAITVHKAQGSEYPVVVLTLARQHGRMLRRNLVYTAITRARRLVVLVVEPDALELAVTARPTPRRYSKLRELLADSAEA